MTSTLLQQDRDEHDRIQRVRKRRKKDTEGIEEVGVRLGRGNRDKNIESNAEKEDALTENKSVSWGTRKNGQAQ